MMSNAPKKTTPCPADLLLKNLLAREPTLTRMKLSQIELHNAIQDELLDILASVSRKIDGASIFSEEAIKLFLEFHPVVVTKTGRHKYSCFGGLRSYQLAKCYLPPDQPIYAIVREDITDNIASQLAIMDLYLTTIGFAMDDQVWELDTTRIWKKINHESLIQFTPVLADKVAYAKIFGIDLKRLSSKYSEPKSTLKEMDTSDDQCQTRENPRPTTNQAD